MAFFDKAKKKKLQEDAAKVLKPSKPAQTSTQEKTVDPNSDLGKLTAGVKNNKYSFSGNDSMTTLASGGVPSVKKNNASEIAKLSLAGNKNENKMSVAGSAGKKEYGARFTDQFFNSDDNAVLIRMDPRQMNPKQLSQRLLISYQGQAGTGFYGKSRDDDKAVVYDDKGIYDYNKGKEQRKNYMFSLFVQNAKEDDYVDALKLFDKEIEEAQDSPNDLYRLQQQRDMFLKYGLSTNSQKVINYEREHSAVAYARSVMEKNKVSKDYDELKALYDERQGKDMARSLSTSEYYKLTKNLTIDGMSYGEFMRANNHQLTDEVSNKIDNAVREYLDKANGIINGQSGKRAAYDQTTGMLDNYQGMRDDFAKADAYNDLYKNGNEERFNKIALGNMGGYTPGKYGDVTIEYDENGNPIVDQKQPTFTDAVFDPKGVMDFSSDAELAGEGYDRTLDIQQSADFAQYMTDDQKKMYAYLEQTQGEAAAERYARQLEKTYTGQARYNALYDKYSMVTNWRKENGVDEEGFTWKDLHHMAKNGLLLTGKAVSTLGTPAVMAALIGMKMRGEDIGRFDPVFDLNNWQNAVLSGATSYADEVIPIAQLPDWMGGQSVGAFLTQTLSSALDNAVQAAAFKGIGLGAGLTGDALSNMIKAGTLSVMGTQVFSQQLLDGYSDPSKSDEQIWADAAASSIAELLSETILSSDAMAEARIFADGGSFRQVLGSMVSEGMEEVTSDVLNAVYNYAMYNESEAEKVFQQYLADYNGNVKEAWLHTAGYVLGNEFMSFAGGAISVAGTGASGMAQNAIRNAKANYEAGKNIYKQGDRGIADSLRMVMQANDPGSKMYKSAEKMLKRMTDEGYSLENMSEEDKVEVAGIQQEAAMIEAEQQEQQQTEEAVEETPVEEAPVEKPNSEETVETPVEEEKVEEEKVEEEQPAQEETTEETVQNSVESEESSVETEESDAETEENKQNDPVEDVKRFFEGNRKNLHQLGKIFRKTMNTISGQFSDALQAANAEKVQSLLANDEGSKDISKVVIDSLIAIANENATADQVDAVEAWTETHPDSIVTGITADIYNRENGFAPSAYTGEVAKKAQIYKDLFLSPYAKGTAEFALNTLRFATDKATAAASAIANAVGDSVAGRIGRVNKEGTTQVVSPDGHSTDIKSLPTEYKTVDGVLSGKTEINGVETYVAVDSLVGANDTEGAMIGAITAYSGQDANVANAISAGAKAFGSDIAAYVHALDNAQKYGFYGLTEGRVMEMVGTDNKAVNDAIKAVWSKATEARNAVNKAQRNRVGKGSGKIDDSRIKGKKLNHVQENAIGVLKSFADTGSVNVRLFDSTKDSAMVDGQYDPNTNTISIDISAGLDAKDSSSVAGQMIAKVFSHELTHYIQSNNADGYQTLVSVLNDALRNGGKESFNALVNNRLAAYERRQNDILERKAKGEQISKEDQKFIEKGTVELEMLATDEAVANACEFMLRDSKVVQEVAENVYKKDAGLAQKILDLINKFVERVKNAFNAYSKAVGSEEAKALAETGIKNIEAVQKAWDDALRTAMKNAIGNVQQFAGTMSNAVSVVEAVQQAEEQKADYPVAESNAVEANVQTPEWAEYSEAEPLEEIAKEVQENGRIRDEVIPEIDINPDSVELRTTSINGKNYIVPAVTVPYSGVHIDMGLDRAYDESTSVFLNDFKALRPMARIAAQEVLNDTENRIAPQTYMVDSDAANAVLGQSVMRVGAVRSPMMAWITSRQRMGKNGQPLKVKGEGKLGVSGIGWSYDQIRKNMQKLIDCIDKGVEIQNTKTMKIAEVICDKVMTEGFEHIDYAATPCMEYIMLKAQIEGTSRNGFGNERTMNDPAFKNAIDFWAGLGVDRAELFGTKVSINQLYELNEAGKLSDDNMRTVLKQSGYAEEYENMIDFELDTDDLKAAVKGVLDAQKNDIPAEYHDDKELGYRIMSREFMGIKEAEVRNSSKIDQDYMAAVNYSKNEIDDLTKEYAEANQEIMSLRNRKRELDNSEEMKKILDDFSNARSEEDRNNVLEAAERFAKETGYGEIDLKIKSLNDRIKEIRKTMDAMIKANNAAKEKAAIEKSGLSDAEYYSKKAVKEFGYTTDYKEAGYMLQNGKLLNFTGEKGKHYGTRGQDHRAIGTIFEDGSDSNGTKAMNRFMNMGNVRVMAESPGLDISNVVPLTMQQMAGIRSFVRNFNDGNVYIDISDKDGKQIASYEYHEGVKADKVLADIQYTFQNGTKRDNSLAEFRYSEKMDQDYMAAVEADDMETAQKLVDEAARKAGYTDRMYHGTPYGTFNKFREWSYFTANKDYADRYQNPSASSIRGRYESATNQRTYSVYVKADNAFDTREDEAREVFYNEFYRQWGNGTDLQDSGLPDWVDGSDLVEFFEENDYDYDAVFLDEGADGGYGEEVVKRGISMMVKDSAQIKSADPVTRDDNGDVIPLSERFNSDEADIRYSSKDIEELKDYPTSGLRFKSFDLYTNEQQNTIKRYLEGVDESILEYFKKYTDGLDVSKPINFGTPSNSVVDAAMRIHGIDVSEYAYEMNKYACEHIEFRHGESGESNTTMNDENDVARMKWVIENADNSYEGRPTRAYSEPKFEGSKYSRKARTIVFEKAVDGTVMVVIAAPVSQRKVLGIVTAFVNTKKTVEPNGYTNNSTPELYAQSDDQQSSANSITYDNLNINSNTDKAEENYVDEAEARDSEKASTLTDRDLLRMASDAVAQTETEREYLKMYRESTGEMSKLNDMIEGERENIERYKKAGNTAEVTKATNRLNVLQQQFDRAVEKSSKLEESKPLAGVMFRIRQDTEAAVLDALTQVREVGNEVVQNQIAKYKEQVKELRSRITKLNAENKARTQHRDNAKAKNQGASEEIRTLEAKLAEAQNNLSDLQNRYDNDIASVTPDNIKIGDYEDAARNALFRAGGYDEETIRNALENQAEKYRAKIEKLNQKLAAKTKEKIREYIQRDINDVQRKLNAIEGKNAFEVASIIAKEQYSKQKALARMRSQLEASATRKKIRRIIDNFNARLTKPNANKYIPVDMVRGIVEALDSFDMSYVRNGEEKVSAKVAQMKGVYDALKQDGTYQFMHDGVISEMLTKLQETMGDTPFRNLTNEQLDQVYEVMKSLHKTITEATHLKAGEYARNIFDAVKNMIEETDAADPVLKGKPGEFVNWQLTPMRAFRRFGGYAKNSTWESVGKTFVKAEEKYYEVQRTAQEFFQDLTEKKDFENLVKYGDKDLVDVGLTDMHTGKAVKITRGMMLSIYMHLANEDNRGGIMRGGFTIPGMKDYYSGRQKRAFSTAQMRTAGVSQKFEEIRQQMFKDGQINEQLGEDAYQTLEDQANAELDAMRDVIASKMTDFEKKLVERVHEWNDNMSRNMLNEVTMDIYGFKKAAVDNYYPIHRDSDFLEGNFDSIKRDYNLENVGFLKERVKASQPIMLTDICYEMSGSINGVARYVGYVRAQRDFNKLYSGRLPGMTKSVKNSIAKKFGAGNQAMGVTGAQYIENLMQDITGSRARSEDSIFAAIRRNLPRATLSANVRVALSQLASIPTAAAALDFGSVARGTMEGLRTAFSTEAKNELASKSAWFWQRYRGEGGMVEFQDMKTGGNIVDRAYNKFNKMTKGKILNWCQATDVMATSMMYKMSEIWVKNHTDLHEGTDEFKAAVDEKYSEVLLETQPMYTTTGRSDLLRGTNELMKMFTMYKTQANQNFNILYDANANFRKMKQDLKNGVNGVTQEDVHKAGAKLANSVVAVGFVAPAVYAVLRFVGNAIMMALKKYKNKDDDITIESVLGGITNEAAGSIASMVVMGSDLYNFAYARITGTKYWGLEDSAVGKIGDVLNSLGNDDLTDPSKRAKLAEDLASMSGIPVGNVKNFINAGTGWIEAMKEGDLFASVHTDTTYMARMLNAAIKGNVNAYTAAVEELTASGMSQEDMDKKLVSMIGKRYKNGKIDRDTAERIMRDYAGQSDGKIFQSFDKWDYERENGTTEGYSVYAPLREAAAANDYETAKTIFDSLVQSGIEEKKIRSDITSQYNDGSATNLTALRFKTNSLHNNDKYDSLMEAIVTGKGIQEAVSELKKSGYKTKQIMGAINTAFGTSNDIFYNMNLYNSTDAKLLLSRILDAYEAIGLSRAEEEQWIRENWLYLDRHGNVMK